MKTFYVIQDENVGPNASQDPTHGEPVYTISTVAATGNMQPFPVITEGWCGTTNDNYRFAHGEFETLEAARAKCAELGATVEIDANRLGLEGIDEGAVEYYTTPEGVREQWAAEEWLYDARHDLGVTAGSTDEELQAIAEAQEAEALAATDQDRPYGVRITGTLDYLKSLRDDLRD